MVAKVFIVPTNMIDQAWQTVGIDLEQACLRTGGEIGADTLWRRCREGIAFLFCIEDEGKVIGASVWGFETWARGRIFRCYALYGTGMAGWLDQHRKSVLEAALAGGATELVAEGRKGWGRVFRGAVELRRVYVMGVTDVERQQNNDAIQRV